MTDVKMADSVHAVTGKTSSVRRKDLEFHDADWWSRRTALEKRMIVAAMMLFLLAGCAVVGYLVVNINTESKIPREECVSTEADICKTEGCVTTAARMLNTADMSADPCEDFYQYACGTWMKNNIIPEDKSMIGTFDHLKDNLLIKLKTLLEIPSATTESTSIKETKVLYRSCMDLDKINARGGQPLLDSLSQLGGWPVLSGTWNESDFRLENLLAQLSIYNAISVVDIFVWTSMVDSSYRNIYIDQPQLGMRSRDYYLGARNATTLMAYEDYITKVAVGLGADPTQARTQAQEMVDFEIQLANISVPIVDRMNENTLYNPTNITQLSQTHAQFDWNRYVRGILVEGAGLNVTPEDVIINRAPSYFRKLFSILEKTPKRVLANYAIWVYIKKTVKLLDSSFREFADLYTNALQGTSIQEPRWQTCIKYVNKEMSLTVSRLYVDEHFHESARSNLLNMIAYLKGSFYELLEEVSWMNEKTRELAREKAAVMGEKIGYPDAILNNSFLDSYYEHFEFNVSQYYENVHTELHLSFKKHYRKLREAVDKMEWRETPATVNAFYNDGWNQIVFPAGYLQAPFYSQSQPNSVNFGAVGSVIGHEITHGFDSRGRLRDKDGILRQWWEPDVIERFELATQCFINQSSSFFIPEAGKYVNGHLTVGEDVADSGGVKQSYKAYRKWVADKGEEPLLPGLPLTHDQLFFLSWGQKWCKKITDENALRHHYLGYHSPNRLRSFAPLRNLPEFAEVFQCKPKSVMNPTHRCTVW